MYLTQNPEGVTLCIYPECLCNFAGQSLTNVSNTPHAHWPHEQLLTSAWPQHNLFGPQLVLQTGGGADSLAGTGSVSWSSALSCWHGLVGRSVVGSSHGSTRCAAAAATGAFWLRKLHLVLPTGQLEEVFTGGDPQRRAGDGGVWNIRTAQHQN